MPDIISQQADVVAQKKSNKKLVVVLALAVILGIGLAVVALSTLSRPQKQGPKPDDTGGDVKPQDTSVIQASLVRTYKLEMPREEAVTSFLYFGEQTTVFTPLTAYTLTKGNQLIATPLYVSLTAQNANPWCEGYGKDKMPLSTDQKVSFCLENIDGKNIKIRKADIKKNEYKEFTFGLKDKDLFATTRTSRVIASRDGDSAIIYSPVGAYVLETISGALYKIELPQNLDIVKVVNLSNVEVALITFGNKIYRVNYSSRQGGLFEVNFTGTPQDRLADGLKTARLSKDGRKIVFTISGAIENLPKETDINYQSVVAYNIDLNTAKVADELGYEEKFLLSCKYLVSDKHCLYKNTEEKDRTTESVVYAREFDKPVNEVIRVASGRSGSPIKLDVNASSQSYTFIKAPLNYLTIGPNPKESSVWLTYFYNADNKSLVPLVY